MKRTKPTQSAIAQKLQLELAGKVFWFAGSWYYWSFRHEQWRYLQTVAMQRRVQDFLDQLPEFEDGYTAAMVAGVERLLRNHLAFNGEFWNTRHRSDPNLLNQDGGEVVL